MNPRREISPTIEHRRQMTWQVWVPLGASILIFLGLAGLVVAGALAKSDQIDRWGSLSAVWIIFPVLFVGLIFQTIIIACIFGMSKLLEKMPDWMGKLLMGVVQIGQVTRRAADISTRPVMTVNEVQSRVETLWKKTLGH